MRQNSASIEAERRRRQAAASTSALTVTTPLDPLKWIETEEVTIEDPHQAGTSTIIRFVLWKAQVEYLNLLHYGRQTITLKARQLGVSWVTIVYCVWLCIFHENVTVLVLSKDKDAAEEIIRRARGVFRRLKNKPTQEAGKENKTTIQFTNGSRFKCFAATKNAGTSFTGTFVIIDEADKMEFGLDLYTSIRPTIADGGRIAIIFTAFGEDGLGRRLWEVSSQPGSPIKQFFIPWHERPGRTVEWYNIEARAAVSMAHHRQEYPATPEEALGFTDLDNRLIQSPEQWSSLGIIPTEVSSGLSCVLALDAGVSSDLFVAVGVCWHPKRKGIPVIRDVKTWEPPKTKNGQVDFSEAKDWVTDFVRTRRVRRVVYDPYQLVSMGQDLQRICDAKEFPQGAKRIQADTSFRGRITQGNILHLNDPTLASHIENANIKIANDEDKKLRIIKRSKNKKIDLAVASSMAVWELATEFPFTMETGGAVSSAPVIVQKQQRTAFNGMPNLLYRKIGRLK